VVDIEKVIKGLGIHSDRSDKTDCDDCPYSKDDFSKGGCIGQLCSDALALLKEQEPKPVKVVKNAYNHEFYYCPRCERSFYNLIYGKPKFCDKCGQELMWE